MSASRGSRSYELPDPELRAYDHGIGTLSIGGELMGHLASVVGRISLPSRGLWPWFLIVWLDGTRENPFFAWLPEDDAARMWAELGLVDSDF